MTSSLKSFPVSNGAGGLPRITLATPDGARAELYLHGAHLTSWIPAGGGEALYLSPKADFLPGAAIRGGVPVIFPQFAALGPLPKHGFARTADWELLENARDHAVLRLRADEASLQPWPHKFELEYTVRIGGEKLELSLKVSNTDSTPFDFSAALHTYLRVADLREASVWGLEGLRYSDSAHNNLKFTQDDEWLVFPLSSVGGLPGEVDRIYYKAAGPVQVVQEQGKTVSEKSGFGDVVVWNPGPEKCAAFKDMEPDGYLKFVCIEAAVVEKPVRLAAGESWVGTQALVKVKKAFGHG
jgi:glucose-6-phosphate 1-epimerase